MSGYESHAELDEFGPADHLPLPDLGRPPVGMECSWADSDQQMALLEAWEETDGINPLSPVRQRQASAFLRALHEAGWTLVTIGEQQ